MNPVLPQFIYHNTFMFPKEQKSMSSFEVNSSSISQRQGGPHSVVHRPLIPPSSSIARAILGHSSSMEESNSRTDNEPQHNRQMQRPTGTGKPRSNLSVLLDSTSQPPVDDAEERVPIAEKCLTASPCEPEGSSDEADSASGPPPTRLTSTRSAPSVCLSQRFTLPSNGAPPPLALEVPTKLTDRIGSLKQTFSRGTMQSAHRRCISSKEFASLAPLSGSPYSNVLKQKVVLESTMAKRLQERKESWSRDHSPVSFEAEDASISSASRRGRMANETRNRRREEHNRAVTDDLCEIVTDLFVAESKLLNPSTYGVNPSMHRETVLHSVRLFVEALPSRYALGADTPSEVLLHMRLMEAARSDSTRAAVHIMNIKDDSYWHKNPSDGERSLKLVTISCADATGLLEYISKLLATGGSRVLDADVMLSSDNIVLDRFVVEMSGILRLDKLSKYIESFLGNSQQRKKGVADGHGLARAIPSSSTSELSNDSTNKSEPSTTVYYQPAPELPDVPTPQEIQEEIDSAVPLTEVLASQGNLGRMQGNLIPNAFQPLTRHWSMPPTPLRTPSSPCSPNDKNDSARRELSPKSPERRGAAFRPECQMDRAQSKRKTLVNRPGYWDLGEDTHPDEEPPLDYVALDAMSGTDIDKRVIPLIPFDELMLIETLGMGRISTIYRAVWQRHGNIKRDPTGSHMLALKVAMVNPTTFDTSHVDELRGEADICARLRHPNICDLVGIAADAECFCLAYEFCEGGSLLSLLSDTSRYYEYLPIALDIANGMAYLHSRNIIHRDLKPSNILLTRDQRAKIADFGMSVANAGQELTAETGTYRYMAPEVIRHESYSSNADVYSFGICLWQLITRQIPFGTLSPIQAAYAVAEGHRPPIPSSTPLGLQEIIAACWDQDSYKRPSFTYIAMALADYAKTAFSPANVGTQTLQIANNMLANVEGNSSVNVDFTTPVSRWPGIQQELSLGSDVGLEI